MVQNTIKTLQSVYATPHGITEFQAAYQKGVGNSCSEWSCVVFYFFVKITTTWS
jgi:hypothetical protein